MPTSLGKKSGGAYYAKSGDYEQEFPECKSRYAFYALLRQACRFPPKMRNEEVWEEVTRHWSITPAGFVRDPEGAGSA